MMNGAARVSCLAMWSILLGGALHGEGSASGAVRFDRDVRPILSAKCFKCHGPNKKNREAHLRLDRKESAFAERDGVIAIKPGDLRASEAWRRISTKLAKDRMPPPDSKKTLSPDEKNRIRRWIEQGAKWSEHWAFVPPRTPALPRVSDPKWSRNPIDRFILARLDRANLKPSPEADRRTQIRRLSFDLTGLPPAPKDVETFVNDKSPQAYENLVDRLLASPHYGERMALMWLDTARYGDTSVHHADGPRDMWAWRDRVVRSYNENLPFDRFSREQLAGDLIPDATIEQKIASGFNRNNATTDEGGLIEEEYRVEYAVDRVKTTSMAWLGLSMECGQCHDHKYDPVTQEEYYRFYAFFNISADRGKQTRKGNATPTLSVPDPEKERQLPGVRAAIQEQQAKRKAHAASVDPAFQAWVKKMESETKALPEPKDPLLRFSLDEGKGKVATDEVNPKKKAHIRGKVRWVNGAQGKALRFDGRNVLDLGDVGNFERTDSFSYGARVKIDPNASGALLARMEDPGTYRGYDLLISGGHLEVHIIHKWPDNAIKVRTKRKLKPKVWNHVLASYDGSSKAKGVTIYVNGEPWAWDVQQDRLSASIQTKKPLYVGGRNKGSRLKGQVDDVRVYGRSLTASEVRALANADALGPLLATPAAKRTKKQTETLRQHYLDSVDPEYRKLSAALDKLKAREAGLRKPISTVMIMQDMAKPRDTFVLARGRYDAPTKQKVTPGFPAVLPRLPEGAPANRLGLAQWLFRKDHPLTARVAVNRFWQMLFGTGIVTTPADFGSQGDFPSHPDLLDWLACDFRDHGWDIKRTIKQVVLSATYRQSSRHRPDIARRDPDNRLLARGPRFRLQGEVLRDNALAISGLLVKTLGGPGVKPYQPPGLWKQVGLGGNPKFVQDHGEKLYRRSLYTYWKRSAPPPNMQIFDAPTREKCIVRRPRTNTPLQALVTLNDVQFVEAARNLAQRMMREGGATPAQRADFGFALATARPPRPSERKVLLDVYQASLRRYRADAEAAKKLLSFGESKRDASLDAAEHAAWTAIGNLLLNLDETLTRE